MLRTLPTQRSKDASQWAGRITVTCYGLGSFLAVGFVLVQAVNCYIHAGLQKWWDQSSLHRRVLWSPCGPMSFRADPTRLGCSGCCPVEYWTSQRAANTKSVKKQKRHLECWDLWHLFLVPDWICTGALKGFIEMCCISFVVRISFLNSSVEMANWG